MPGNWGLVLRAVGSRGSPGPGRQHTPGACSVQTEFSAETLAPAPGMARNPTSTLISSVTTGKALPISEFPHLQNRLRDQKTYLEVPSSL